MRPIGGLLLGIVAALLAIWVVGFIAGQFFAVDAPTDPRQGTELVAALASAPAGLQISLVASWFFGGLVGAAVAKRVAGAAWPGWIVAGLLALLLATLFLVPLPVWMQVLAVLAPLAGALLADRLVTGASLEDARA